MKKSTKGIFATALTAVLGLALLGGAAAAGFAPNGTTATADHGPDTTRLEQVLDGLVDDGVLSAEQRDAILAKVAEAGHDDEDEDTDEDEDSDNGKDKRDLAPKLRFDIHRLTGGWLKAAVEYLGLERKELFERLRAGETLAEIADSESLVDKSAAELIDTLEAPAFAKVDRLVENERLTAEQGQTAKERVTQFIEKALDREFPAKPRAERAPKTEREDQGKKNERGNSGRKP